MLITCSNFNTVKSKGEVPVSKSSSHSGSNSLNQWLIYQVAEPYFLFVLTIAVIYLILAAAIIAFLGIPNYILFFCSAAIIKMLVGYIFMNGWNVQMKKRLYKRLFDINYETFEKHNILALVDNIDPCTHSIIKVLQSILNIVLILPFWIVLSYYLISNNKGSVIAWILSVSFVSILFFVLTRFVLDRTRLLQQLKRRQLSISTPALQNFKKLDVDRMKEAILKLLDENTKAITKVENQLSELENLIFLLPMLGLVIVLLTLLLYRIDQGNSKQANGILDSILNFVGYLLNMPRWYLMGTGADPFPTASFNTSTNVVNTTPQIQASTGGPVSITISADDVTKTLNNLSQQFIPLMKTAANSNNMTATLSETSIMVICVYFTMYTAMLLRQVNTFSMQFSNILEVFGGVVLASHQQKGKQIIDKISKIELRNVTFKRGNKVIVKNVSFTLHAGDRVMFMGLSGSGKSTMFDLCNGLLRPSEGDIFINDINIKDCDLTSIRKTTNYLTQKAMILNMTAIGNFKLHNQELFNEEVMDYTLEKVGLEFMKQRKNEELGENGSKLSGGQQIRFAAAMGLVKKASFCCFDEVTSSLDPLNANILRHILWRLYASDEIVVWVDHSLANINSFTKIVLITKDGTCLIGRHEDLMVYPEYAAYFSPDLLSIQNTSAFSNDNGEFAGATADQNDTWSNEEMVPSIDDGATNNGQDSGPLSSDEVPAVEATA